MKTTNKDVDDLLKEAGELARMTGRSFGSQVFSVKIDGGGYGVLICVMAVVVMLVMTMYSKSDVERIDRHTADRLQEMRDIEVERATRADAERAELRASINANKAYLAAIYQMAPQLKLEKESKESDE